MWKCRQGDSKFLDRQAQKWSDIRVSIPDVQDSEFRSWSDLRSAIPKEGEIFVARDQAMEAVWDELGYALIDGEGPFAIHYSMLNRPMTRLLALEDPYVRGDFRFEPYEVKLVGGLVALTTIVTPDSDGEFSRALIESLALALHQT